MAIQVSGRQIAQEWEKSLQHAVSLLQIPPKLALIVVGNDPAMLSFVRLKKSRASEIGILVTESVFPSHVTTEELADCVRAYAVDDTIDGIVVQMPLPAHVALDEVLSLIPVSKDVDVLSLSAMALFRQDELPIAPPVALAVQEICTRYEIVIEDADVLVLGHGRLVGAPVAVWLRHNGARVTVVDRPVARLEEFTKEAEVIISGVGTPCLVRPEHILPGVVLIDAGTSESEGELRGDIDPACQSLARVMTPVPGGVGPITVMMLFRNLVVLAERSRAKVAYDLKRTEIVE